MEKVKLPGFARRFWQGSTDHRGTPEFPGLVCTLVPIEGQFCWGLAYLISDEDWPGIRDVLDYREKDGYELVRLRCDHAEVQEVWTYVADEGNPSYIGPRPRDELVRRMAHAAGESGPNPEYLFRLERRLAELQIEDPHVTDLAAALRGLGS